MIAIEPSLDGVTMSAHHNVQNPFNDDFNFLDEDAPARPHPGRQRFTCNATPLNLVAYEDLTGNIVVVDLISDDEEVVPLDRVNRVASVDPGNGLTKVTLDDALREILQVLPDIEPKALALFLV